MKVLIIEDQPVELKLAYHVLADGGHSVDGAPAAEEAIAAIRQDPPQIILLDMSLPGMDGLSLVRKLKADPMTRNIIVIAVTSYPERYTRAQAMAAGCGAYLVKPLNTRTLSTDVTAAFESPPGTGGTDHEHSDRR